MANTKKNHLGETCMMNCGMKAKIARYGGYKDIDVEFEDGTKMCGRAYDLFFKGGIMNLKVKNNHECFGFSVKYGYGIKEDAHYICKCTICGYEDILTPTQMREHWMKNHTQIQILIIIM